MKYFNIKWCLMVLILFSFTPVVTAQNTKETLLNSIKTLLPKELGTNKIESDINLNGSMICLKLHLSDSYSQYAEELRVNDKPSNIAKIMLAYERFLPKSMLSELSKNQLGLVFVIEGNKINGELKETITPNQLSWLAKAGTRVADSLLLCTRIELINLKLNDIPIEKLNLTQVSLNGNEYIHEMTTSDAKIINYIKQDESTFREFTESIAQYLYPINNLLKKLNFSFSLVINDSETGDTYKCTIPADKKNGSFGTPKNDKRVLLVNEKVVDEVPPVVNEVKVFDVVEQMPKFGTYTYNVFIPNPQDPQKGTYVTKTASGDEGLMAYLNTNIKYPLIAEENGIQGRVVTTFIIERDGSITDVNVIRSVDPSLDKEAVRVVRSMPKWNPGMMKGEPVRVKFTLPVTFRLQ